MNLAQMCKVLRCFRLAGIHWSGWYNDYINNKLAWSSTKVVLFEGVSDWLIYLMLK